jgi:hypothetical protein
MMSTKSFEQIHYGLRPAKNVERKMVCEALRKLTCFAPLNTYRYVGFGSTYFSDFALFHKALGLKNMDSIERDLSIEDRCKFNQPYKCITIHMGEAGTILPTLSWDARAIVWLDYDGKLREAMFADIRTVTSKLVSGSPLLVTVNANPRKFASIQISKQELSGLKQRVGTERMPSGIKPVDLEDWGLAKVCRRIIMNEIQEILAARNAVLPDNAKVEFRQIFNFHYRDGARMLTIGGIFVNREDAAKFSQAEFEKLSFCRFGDPAYVLEVPKLTFREIRHLDKSLPLGAPVLEKVGIPEEDIKTYAEIYRFFPAFAETEV